MGWFSKWSHRGSGAPGRNRLFRRQDVIGQTKPSRLHSLDSGYQCAPSRHYRGGLSQWRNVICQQRGPSFALVGRRRRLFLWRLKYFALCISAAAQGAVMLAGIYPFAQADDSRQFRRCLDKESYTSAVLHSWMKRGAAGLDDFCRQHFIGGQATLARGSGGYARPPHALADRYDDTPRNDTPSRRPASGMLVQPVSTQLYTKWRLPIANRLHQHDRSPMSRRRRPFCATADCRT